MQGGLIERGERADTGNRNPENDADGGGVFSEGEPDVAVEKRFPALGGGEGESYESGADCADYCV